MITIRYFAKLKDIVGKDKERLELENITVKELLHVVGNKYEGFEAYASSLHVAINEEYAQQEDMIADGDDVAFIPPVSGG